MANFTISRDLKSIFPACRLGILRADVIVQNSSKALLNEISIRTENIRKDLPIEKVNRLPLIEQTRKAYRLLGKDPSRYRPSAEALTRRIIQRKGIYSVNNIVDLLNLVSVRSGYSIGGYDMDFISGKVILTKGSENEPYNAIGRGTLNIHLLPVLIDDMGTFGSPTSDSIRTMVTETTRRFIMVFFDFMSDNKLNETMQMSEFYLKEYGTGTNFTSLFIT